MCGKFTAMASWSETGAFTPGGGDDGYRGAEDFEVTFRVMGLVPLLVWDPEQQERRVIAARWGFPHPDDWRRPQPIHARAETIDTTRAFADAFRGGTTNNGGRGIVLVKTFNEAPDSGEQHVFEPDAAKTGIAFVWRRFDVGAAAPLIACVMVTVAANEMIAALPTNRMPAILEPSDWAKWTGEEPATPAELKAMLKTREGVNWKMRREYRAKATVREPTGMLF
jgi:putative SOS response-associated peptidase YedK